MNTVIQAYRFALDPTPAQEAALRSHCGGQRFAYNWGLALVKANLDQREAERSYGIPVDRRTPLVSWSAYSLRKLWNHCKDTVAPWWGTPANLTTHRTEEKPMTQNRVDMAGPDGEQLYDVESLHFTERPYEHYRIARQSCPVVNVGGNRWVRCSRSYRR